MVKNECPGFMAAAVEAAEVVAVMMRRNVFALLAEHNVFL